VGEVFGQGRSLTAVLANSCRAKFVFIGKAAGVSPAVAQKSQIPKARDMADSTQAASGCAAIDCRRGKPSATMPKLWQGIRRVPGDGGAATSKAPS